MMKSAALFLLFSLLITLLPMLAALPGDAPAAGGQTAAPLPTEPAAQTGSSGTAADADTLLPPQAQLQGEGAAGSIAVFDEATGQLLELSMRQYLIGALMSEMPLSFQDEALKAQVVATHSFARYSEAFRLQHPQSELQGAAFSVNTAARQGYLTEEAAKARFGSSYYLQLEKAAAIVDSVLNELLYYNGAPAAAAYHAISAGRTEASENVWTQPLPYLVSVDSRWDEQAEGYESRVSVPLTEFCSALRGKNSAFSPQEVDASLWHTEISRSEAGYVLSLHVGGCLFTGSDIRELFSLRSSCFTLEFTQDTAEFTVHGYGHGVGMSQVGADAMAREGADYRAILAHYYTGTQLLPLQN
ncbi:MAG: stage II sporulation protein D [Oscillospiraceae bacterium]|nr:stage II sporulation protein D [Oscillospiraceae bacterium]